MSERATTSEPLGSGTGLPGLAAAGALLAVLAGFFWLTGALQPTAIPDYASSPRQITGMALMLILVPAYLVGAASLAQRRSLALVEETRERLAEPGAADAAAGAIRSGLRRTWKLGIASGFLMGLLNTNPLEVLRSEVPILEGSISFGQVLMWCLIGLLLGVRISAARAFRRIADTVELDVLRPDRLKSIARSGVVDVAIIAGALLITPLQSLDAEFRWYNYQFGLLVGLPAAAFFLVWPIQPLHRRNRADRDARLGGLERQIHALGSAAPATPETSARLEALLAHRDRLRSVSTWPLSTGLLSRVVLYLVIPPVAWAGAALVERVVDRALGG